VDWSQLEQLRVWIAAVGFVEAVEESDMIWWLELLAEELHYVDESEAGDVYAADPSDERTHLTYRCLETVPTVVLSVMWVHKQHGTRYQENYKRLEEAGALPSFISREPSVE